MRLSYKSSERGIEQGGQTLDAPAGAASLDETRCTRLVGGDAAFGQRGNDRFVGHEHVEGQDRTQSAFFPERLDGWIEEDSTVRVIDGADRSGAVDLRCMTEGRFAKGRSVRGKSRSGRGDAACSTRFVAVPSTSRRGVCALMRHPGNFNANGGKP